MNGVLDKVYLLQNALARTHRNVSLSVNVNNQGGIKVLEDRDWDQQTTQTIVLDDLLSLIQSSTAIIKIDIGEFCLAWTIALGNLSLIHATTAFIIFH